MQQDRSPEEILHLGLIGHHRTPNGAIVVTDQYARAYDTDDQAFLFCAVYILELQCEEVLVAYRGYQPGCCEIDVNTLLAVAKYIYTKPLIFTRGSGHWNHVFTIAAGEYMKWLVRSYLRDGRQGGG